MKLKLMIAATATALAAQTASAQVFVIGKGLGGECYQKTKDGFEWQFGCNHLGHFLLASLLTPLMIKTAETTGKASRLVCLLISYFT